MADNQQKATDELAAKMEKEYGPKRDALQQKVNKIEARRDKASGLTGVMYKASGMQEADQDRHKIIVAAIKDIGKKIVAEQGKLLDRQHRETEIIEKAHVSEANDLEQGIDKARELSESFSFAATDRYLTLADVFNLNETGRGEDGPGRVSFGHGREGRELGRGV